MQLAFSSNAYLNYPLEDTVARIAAIGYRGMELLADVPHAWPAGLLPEQRREIRACLDRHSMTISNINLLSINRARTRFGAAGRLPKTKGQQSFQAPPAFAGAEARRPL